MTPASSVASTRSVGVSGRYHDPCELVTKTCLGRGWYWSNPAFYTILRFLWACSFAFCGQCSTGVVVIQPTRSSSFNTCTEIRSAQRPERKCSRRSGTRFSVSKHCCDIASHTTLASLSDFGYHVGRKTIAL